MFWACAEGKDGAVEHQARESDEVESGHGLRQALVVLLQPTEARCPGEGALYNPPTRQKHKAALRVWVLTTAKRMPQASIHSVGSSPV